MAALPSQGGIKMNDDMVRISNVSKSYGQQRALDQVTIPVKKGQICGLVGENGAGKTTLLRILCGLSFPTEGEIEVSKNLKIGSLIEAPALYQNLSAFDNLKYLGLQLGLDQLNSRVEEVLDIIGLATVPKKKKAKNFWELYTSLHHQQYIEKGLLSIKPFSV